MARGTYGKGSIGVKKTGRKETRTYVRGPSASGRAAVEFTFGATKEVGDHEFVRFDVTLRLPCEPDEIDLAWRKAEKWVRRRVKALSQATDEASDD